MINRILSVLIGLVLLTGCQLRKDNQSQSEKGQLLKSFKPKYAKGFAINYYSGYKELVIHDPWSENDDNESIFLVTDTAFAKGLKGQVIKAPVKKWIPLSSTMVNYVDLLGNKSTICGVAEPQYISDSYVKDKVKTGEIRNVGMAFSPDLEVMLDLEPDFVMVSPFKDNNFSTLKSAGVPVVTNADYLEHTPLGRAEWLLFVGALFGKEEQAEQIFNAIERNYLLAKEKAASAKNQPTVFTGHLYQGIWHTPAGESYMANFFRDAGLNYIYSETKGTGSLSLDFETIFDRADKTENWVLIVNYPGDFSYKALEQMDGRYTDFDAYKQQQVVVTNASGSLFYEKGVLQPDVVLNDLIHLLHSDLDPDYEPVFFYKLKK